VKIHVRAIQTRGSIVARVATGLRIHSRGSGALVRSLQPFGTPVSPQYQRTYITAHAMSGQRAVRRRPDGLIEYASAANADDAFPLVGISAQAADAGGAVIVQSGDDMVEPSWNWTPGEPVFVGVDGVLTQAPPGLAFEMSVGTAIDAHRLQIRLGVPVFN
jgi:hypothetical protein